MTNLLWVLLICMILFPIGMYFIQKHNLNYYKINGRYPEEIEEWLKTRKWYTDFRDNIQQDILNKYRLDDGSLQLTAEISAEINCKVIEVISGLIDKETISSAFSWMDSPEGSVYWGEKEYEFLKWYFGQYIDFHLFK